MEALREPFLLSAKTSSRSLRRYSCTRSSRARPAEARRARCMATTRVRVACSMSFGRYATIRARSPSTGDFVDVGFVGLGAMGQVIVPRLLAAGHRVSGWNRSKERAAPLVAKGMRLADTPTAVAAASDITFSIVTDGAAVQKVALGEQGVLLGMRSGGVYVDMGTMAPDITRAVAAEFAKKGFAMLDAPLSGSPVTVEQGNASLMIGGDKATFERVEPVLRAIGPKVTYIGPSGQASVMKLAV